MIADEKPETLNFAEFIQSGYRNLWVYEPGIQLYVRRGIARMGRGDFELANMTAVKPGHGALTKFLDTYEPFYSLYIENVMHDRLERYLLKRNYGYASHSTLTHPCMIKFKQ